MSLNSLIINTLQSTNVPVAFQNYTGKETTYITFFEYNQMSALNADDQEQKTQYSIQVDVWSKGNYTNLVKQVKGKLKDAGFRRTFETEQYESDTGYFHKVIRFFYYTKNGEE